MASTPNNGTGLSDTATPSSSTLHIDYSTRSIRNILPEPDPKDIPERFRQCCGEPTKLVVAPDFYKCGFWILTCHRNNFNPKTEVSRASLECQSFMLPRPNVTANTCHYCHSDNDLLQTYSTVSLGHWYSKCSQRSLEKSEILQKRHYYRMVTTDSHEVHDIQIGIKPMLPVSHILKDGEFEEVDYDLINQNSYQRTRVNNISDHLPISSQSTPLIRPETNSPYCTPPPKHTPFQRILNKPSPLPTIEIVVIEDHDNSVRREDQTHIKVDYQRDNQSAQIINNGRENSKSDPSPPSHRTRNRIKLKKVNTENNAGKSNPNPTKSARGTKTQSSNTAPTPSPVASPTSDASEKDTTDSTPDASEKDTTEQMDFEMNKFDDNFNKFIMFNDRAQLTLSIHPDSDTRSVITQQLANVNSAYQEYLQVHRTHLAQRRHSRFSRRSPYPDPKTRRR